MKQKCENENLNMELMEIKNEIKKNREIFIRAVVFLSFFFSGLIIEYHYFVLFGGAALISVKNKRKGYAGYFQDSCGFAGVGAGIGSIAGPAGPLAGAAIGATWGVILTFLMDRKNKKELETLFEESYDKELIEKILKEFKYQKEKDIWVKNGKKIHIENKEIGAITEEAKDDVFRVKFTVIVKKRKEELHQSLFIASYELMEKYISGREKKRFSELFEIVEKAITT